MIEQRCRHDMLIFKSRTRTHITCSLCAGLRDAEAMLAAGFTMAHIHGMNGRPVVAGHDPDTLLDNPEAADAA